TVVGNYVERERADLTALFRHGLNELRSALDEKAFKQKYLARVPEADVDAFRARLAGWADEHVPHRAKAKNLMRQVVGAAGRLRLPPGVVALECACGGCNALDEYSLYLAPRRLTR